MPHPLAAPVWSRFATFGVALVVLALVVAGCRRASAPAAVEHPGWPSELVLGLAGGIDAEAALERNAPLAERIQRATGIPVRFYTATSYSAVVQAMRSGHVHGLQVGVFSYLLAVETAEAEALAVYVNTFAEPAVYDARLQPDYYSVIVAKKGRGIRTLADLRGKTFGFVEPASTSGHLVPRSELLGAGLEPDRDVKTRFAGSHAANMIALWNDKVDAAAISEMQLRNLKAHRQIEYCGFPDHEIGRARTLAEVRAVFDACPDGHLAAIHYSFPIPGTPVAFRRDLPADLKAVIKASLLSTPQDPAFVRDSKRWYVDPAPELGLKSLDAYYDRLRLLAKVLDLDLKGLE